MQPVRSQLLCIPLHVVLVQEQLVYAGPVIENSDQATVDSGILCQCFEVAKFRQKEVKALLQQQLTEAK